MTTYLPKAQYDRNTECYFGRVEIHSGNKTIGYRIVRVPRVAKADALRDAEYVAGIAHRTGKIDCGVVR
jgi:hypothetical protein